MSLILTRLVNAIADAEKSKGYDANENRVSKYTLYDLAVKQTDSLINPDVAMQMKKSNVQPLQVPAMVRQSSAIIGGVSCAPACTDATSAMTTLNFTTVSWSMCIKPTINIGNYINEDKEFNNRFKTGLDDAMKVVEGVIFTALDGAKNQVWTGFDPTYTILGTDEVSVISANENLIFAATMAFLNSQDFYASPYYDVIGSSNLRTRAEFYAKQGTGNATNYGYQFNEFLFNYNNRIVDAVGDRATGFILAENSIGLLDWIDPVYRQKYPSNASPFMTETAAGTTEWLSVNAFGLQWGVMKTTTCQDLSAEGGGTADPVYNLQFTTKVAPITTFNSDIATKSNPIIKVRYQ